MGSSHSSSCWHNGRYINLAYRITGEKILGAQKGNLQKRVFHSSYEASFAGRRQTWIRHLPHSIVLLKRARAVRYQTRLSELNWHVHLRSPMITLGGYLVTTLLREIRPSTEWSWVPPPFVYQVLCRVQKPNNHRHRNSLLQFYVGYRNQTIIGIEILFYSCSNEWFMVSSIVDCSLT